MRDLTVTIRYSEDGAGPVLTSAPYGGATYHASGATFTAALASLLEVLLAHADPLPANLMPRRPTDHALASRVADEVRRRRTLSGLSHAELAERASVHESHVRRLEGEAGADHEPTIGTLSVLAAALDCHPRDLLRHPTEDDVTRLPPKQVAQIDRMMPSILKLTDRQITRDAAASYLVDLGLTALTAADNPRDRRNLPPVDRKR